MKTPRPPWLLVLVVLAAHLLVGREVQRIHDGWVDEVAPPMPRRMQVEFVREMPIQPVLAARAPAAPAPARLPRPAASRARPAQSASGPVPELPPEPASAPDQAASEAEPERVAEAASTPLPAASPAAAVASVPLSDEPGAEWPLSTRLSYVLTGNYRGPVHGQAQVEWLRQGRDYQVHLDVGLGPSFAPLMTRRMSSQGRLTPEGIAPQRYDEETRFIVGQGRRASVVFHGADVQLANGAREPVGRGAQDSASQFVQLTWLFLTGREPLQAGRIVQFPLVLPYRQYLWPYEVTGEELLKTPMGEMSAWHLKPVRPPGGGDLSVEVWLAPSLQYLPVRLIIRQDAENFVDMVLKSAPLQAAPESANDIPRRLSP
ncbi:MAG: DUF3108 domain-containing protein [Rubrivivax sp.]|nr:MAG: DUF3108 domain-containing protein [Rubrivivax sp.]